MGGSGAFIAKHSDATSWHELLHKFSPFCSEFSKATKRSQMHKNIISGSDRVGRVRSLRNIPKRLRGTNFCTISACFPSSFLRQQNGPICTKIVRTHQNMSLGSNGVDRVHWLRKIPTRLRGMNFCTSSALLHRVSKANQTVPNAPKLYEMHQNMSLSSNGVERVRSLRKIPTPLRGTNFCTSSARFASSFVSQLNGPKCTKIL